MKPLVSIIIPTYNRVHLIGKTLDSISAQTYTHWECIVVDDGSTDGTDELLADYCERDIRFRYYHRPNNKPKGSNACRNYGFELSKGEYVNWFDDDDLMMIDTLEKKVGAIYNIPNYYQYSLCGFRTFGNDRVIEKKYRFDELVDITSFFIEESIIFKTDSFLYSRDLVHGILYNESLTKLQDLDFAFRVLKRPNIVGINIPEVLIETRVHDESITKRTADGNIIDIMSELYVWKSIYNDTILTASKQSSKIALEKCFVILKQVMLKKKIGYFINQIFGIRGLTIITKVKFCLVAISYYLFGRGDYYYYLEYKKIIS